MAQQNRISVTIPQKTIDDVTNHLADIKRLLSTHLHSLTKEERSSLVKMGDKSQAFVSKALEYSKRNSEFTSKSIDITEWEKDFEAVEDFTPIKNQLAQLLSDVDDTIMILGAEAYDTARWYYNNVQFAATKGDMSAKPIYEDLNKRFVGVKRKKAIEPAL